jgi:hypothetical protein
MVKKHPYILVLAIAMLSGLCHASRDGVVGPTSTGEILIRLVINQGIQISNLEDIDVSIDTQASSDLVIRKRFCVSTNTPGLYTMTAFSDRGGSAPFSLSSNSKDQIDFQLYFRSNLANSIGDQLQPNVPSPRYETDRTGLNCNGQNNAELGLVIPASEINQARGREYKGFLNLTVAIE